MSGHLSDEELQLYALDQQEDIPGKTAHVNNCAVCQEQIAGYKLLIAGIDEQPAAAFDFDLAEAVLSELRATAPKRKRNIRPVIITAFVVITLYIFRNNFLHLLSGISSLFLILSIAACICIISFKAIGMFRRYDRQIKQLNYNE